jgi:hypothetical protein
MCKLASLREIDVILPIYILAHCVFFEEVQGWEVVENEMGAKKQVEERQIGENNGNC